MSEERKITAGTISGATFKSIDIEPSIIVDGKSYTASEFNKAVEMLKQPQLNENQQIVMEFLKVRTSHSNFADAIYQLESSENWLEPEENYDIAYEALNNKERLQVIKVACQWALEQEEE